MLKKTILSLSLLSLPFTGMTALGAGVSAHIYESFKDPEGHTRHVRQIVASDFDNPVIIEGLKEDFLASRKKRCEKNEAGLFVVESEAGAVLGRIGTGAMPLGYQPWPPTTESEITRSNAIFSFYEALLRSIGKEPAPSKKHRVGAKEGENLVHINPSVLVLTVVLGGKFGTVSAQEAIAKLVRAQDIKISEDPGVSEAGIPLLCLSITQKPDFASSGLTTVYSGLPYYTPSAENDGLYFAAATPMVDGVVLPKSGEYPQKDYSAWNAL